MVVVDKSVTSLSSLLVKLTTSIESAVIAAPDDEKVRPIDNGMSLLDIKNELLLSYLQNLVFLILIKVRNKNGSASGESASDATGATTNGLVDSHESESVDPQEIVQKLVQLRVYLEKGVKPLESKLKYQVDKAIRAAESADREVAASKSVHANGHASTKKKTKRHKQHDDASISGSGSGSETGTGSDLGTGSENASESEIDELSYRPNLAAFSTQRSSTSSSKYKADATKPSGDTSGAVQPYRPPRINPTSMPTTTITTQSERGDRGRGPIRSSTIDDFISTEMSQMPVAEPSIGTTITSGGRRTKSDRELREDAERREYEEANFMRLPNLGKKEKRERTRQGGGRDFPQWGGEELRGLGEGLDRIDRVIKGIKSSSGASNSNKRRDEGTRPARMTVDGPRGSGFVDAGPYLGGSSSKRRKTGSRR